MNDIFMTIDTVKNDIEKMSDAEKRIILRVLGNKTERTNH